MDSKHEKKIMDTFTLPGPKSLAQVLKSGAEVVQKNLNKAINKASL